MVRKLKAQEIKYLMSPLKKDYTCLDGCQGVFI